LGPVTWRNLLRRSCAWSDSQWRDRAGFTPASPTRSHKA